MPRFMVALLYVCIVNLEDAFLQFSDVKDGFYGSDLVVKVFFGAKFLENVIEIASLTWYMR